VVRRVAFAFPGDLQTPTGGYAYDRRMIDELRKVGWQVDLVPLGEGFPKPTAEQKSFSQAQLAALEAGVPIVIDGLAFGVLPEAARALQTSHRLLALVHHPLALETGVSEQEARALRASERAALAATRAVIVTSPPTARLLVVDYGVPTERITVALPGTDRGEPAPGSSDGTVRLVSVGAIVKRKGFDLLIAALGRLQDLPWHLTIAGDRGRDLDAVARLDADIARHGLGNRVELLGAITPDHVAELYRRSDIFVLASHFEGYGMAYAEAMAHGLPVIGTTGGAIPETVPSAAGLLVPPDDVAALTLALHRLIEHAGLRQRLAAGAREAALRLPSWKDSAQLFAGAIEAVA
jgi:glycosyltransferase involved in cell wall biosynthesis